MVPTRKTVQPNWMSKQELCKLMEITRQAFERWQVEPVTRVRRVLFYVQPEVLDKRDEMQQAKHEKELARQAAKYEEQIVALQAQIVAILEGESEDDLNPVVEKALLDKARREAQELDRVRADQAVDCQSQGCSL